MGRIYEFIVTCLRIFDKGLTGENQLASPSLIGGEGFFDVISAIQTIGLQDRDE
jgi:hypothetical protein